MSGAYIDGKSISLYVTASYTDKSYTKGYADGKQAEHDAFWDLYQDNGKRTHYRCGFAGKGWYDGNYKPKYPIVANNAYMMYRESNISDIGDVDFSSCTQFINCFQESSIKTARVNLSSAVLPNATDYAFAYCYSLTELYLIVSSSTQFTSTTFHYLSALKNVTIEGIIGQNGFNVQWSKNLTAESYDSILTALSTTASGLSITLPSTAPTTYDATYGDGAWEAKVATRTNWTISLTRSTQ